MITNNYSPAWPASSSAADIGAASAYDVLQNRIFTDPILLGCYPDLAAFGIGEAGLPCVQALHSFLRQRSCAQLADPRRPLPRLQTKRRGFLPRVSRAMPWQVLNLPSSLLVAGPPKALMYLRFLSNL